MSPSPPWSLVTCGVTGRLDSTEAAQVPKKRLQRLEHDQQSLQGAWDPWWWLGE